MKYQIQRALVINGNLFNIGDWMVIDNRIFVKLINILWVDEYSAKIITDEGEFLLDNLESIEKHYYM